MKKINFYLLLTVILLSGCVGNIKLEGSASLAERISNNIDAIQRGYNNKDADIITAVLDPAISPKKQITKDISSSKSIKLKITINRMILNNAGYTAYIAWNRQWTDKNNNFQVSDGTSILSFDTQSLLVDRVEGDNLFVNFDNNAKRSS